ncbi:hypothetical protein CRP01_10275 [Flavilitoribacter nigricans DSM 23189 = NBRC 102662]|uniref:Uncharacterized protein n=1 Tax=Flavilitoribacter nigricans (strain ATCC 23147 / DSM 23189 / NBRC 102662 / NCIMB 1420 / SS-2) TaxID=1122177 RepID=A0A2D0NFW8_FLAN2|nr:hypothetical protein CRP01_10275 [Flavilitoribacter nigricans DSM 23189 = NBRC 102662]
MSWWLKIPNEQNKIEDKEGYRFTFRYKTDQDHHLGPATSIPVVLKAQRIYHKGFGGPFS